MKLSEAEALVSERIPGPKCTIGKLLAVLDETDLATLERWLASDMTAFRVAALLSAADHPVRDQSVQRHRRGDCNCAR